MSGISWSDPRMEDDWWCCASCKKCMRDSDKIKRRDGKGYCQSCKTCIEKMRYRRSREYREKQKKERLKEKQREEKRKREKQDIIDEMKETQKRLLKIKAMFK